jgi:nitrogenase molybdenum-iron protein alpha/beta subunit
MFAKFFIIICGLKLNRERENLENRNTKIISTSLNSKAFIFGLEIERKESLRRGKPLLSNYTA